jgi:oxaloacetate decarboxylase alpha subunit
VLDRIVENGSQRIALEPEPLPPAIPEMRRRLPNMSDEERLLRYSFAGTQVDEMLAAGPTKTEYIFETPIVKLLRELAHRPRFRHVHVQKGALRLDLAR